MAACMSSRVVAAATATASEPRRNPGGASSSAGAVTATGLPSGDEPPEACDAPEALARHGDAVDVIFWSWWPRGDAGDAALAADCAARGLPVVFVGEPAGGITGSAELWERSPDTRPLAGLTVPNWPGTRDCTWVVDASLL